MAALSLTYNIPAGFTLVLPINTGTITSINWGDSSPPDTSTTHVYAASNT